MGKIGVFRVHQGTVKKDQQLFVGDGKKPFRWRTSIACGAETIE